MSDLLEYLAMLAAIGAFISGGLALADWMLPAPELAFVAAR